MTPHTMKASSYASFYPRSLLAKRLKLIYLDNGFDPDIVTEVAALSSHYHSKLKRHLRLNQGARVIVGGRAPGSTGNYHYAVVLSPSRNNHQEKNVCGF